MAAAHDPVALAEIDLYGELIIAAASTPSERLSAARIDQVLRVRPTCRARERAESEASLVPARSESAPH